MDMIRVLSRAIDYVGYDPVERKMKIKFKHGHTIYTFCEVPKEIFDGLLNAPSKGRYYDCHIRDKYRC